MRNREERTELQVALYRAIVELEYVQNVSTEHCPMGLCATAEGEAVVKMGMKLLGVKDLSLEWRKFAKRSQ